MTHGTRFGDFEIVAWEVPCAEHAERRFDFDEGWVDVWVDTEEVWRVQNETRLPSGKREVRVWDFPGTEHGRRRALSTAWRLSRGEDIPAHDTELWNW